MTTKTVPKGDWYWTKDALKYKDKIESELDKLIKELASEIVNKHGKDTVTEEDIKKFIKKALDRLYQQV